MTDSDDDPAYGSADTRKRILDAAWRLIEERGTGVSMTEVSAAADVSRQAVYLHFGNRSGLLVALVGHMDRELRLEEWSRAVREAPSGREALAAMVALHAEYTAEIIGVARLLEAARHTDEAVAAAWEDRMSGRRRAHHRVVQRIADEGDLAGAWDVSTASRLFHAWTMPSTWDELVTERGWSTDEFREHVTRALTSAFLSR